MWDCQTGRFLWTSLFPPECLTGTGVADGQAPPNSSANGRAPTLLNQRQKLSPDLGEQRRRDEPITEHTWAARQWREAAIRPFIDIMLGYYDPAWRVIQTDGLTDARRNLDANGIARGWSQGGGYV